MASDTLTPPVVWVVRYDSLEKVISYLATATGLKDIRDPITNANILFWVAQRKNDEEALEIAQNLIDNHAVDPKQKDSMQQTCLFYAARDGLSGLASYLVSKGCDPNGPDKVGQTSLFYAARDGRTECMVELLKLGGDPNQLDNNKQSCLFYAARDGRFDTTKALLEQGANPCLKDSQRRTALTFAKGNGHHSIVNLLKKCSAVKEGYASCNGSEGVVTKGGIGMKRRGGASSFGGGVPVDHKISSPLRKKYRLQFHLPCEDEDLWIDAPLSKVEEFELSFPDIAVWPKSRPVAESSNSSLDFLKKEWYPLATSLVQSLSKYQGGHIFEKPVDAKKQNCPDYYDIIKRPMSFSCIKTKLRRYNYSSAREFLDDVQLVFDNCALYNKEGSVVALTGKAMERYFSNQVLVTRFGDFIARETKILSIIKESCLKTPIAVLNEPPCSDGVCTVADDKTEEKLSEVSENSTEKAADTPELSFLADNGVPTGMMGSEDTVSQSGNGSDSVGYEHNGVGLSSSVENGADNFTHTNAGPQTEGQISGSDSHLASSNVNVLGGEIYVNGSGSMASKGIGKEGGGSVKEEMSLHSPEEQADAKMLSVGYEKADSNALNASNGTSSSSTYSVLTSEEGGKSLVIASEGTYTHFLGASADQVECSVGTNLSSQSDAKCAANQSEVGSSFSDTANASMAVLTPSDKVGRGNVPDTGRFFDEIRGTLRSKGECHREDNLSEVNGAEDASKAAVGGSESSVAGIVKNADHGDVSTENAFSQGSVSVCVGSTGFTKNADA